MSYLASMFTALRRIALLSVGASVLLATSAVDSAMIEAHEEVESGRVVVVTFTGERDDIGYSTLSFTQSLTDAGVGDAGVGDAGAPSPVLRVRSLSFPELDAAPFDNWHGHCTDDCATCELRFEVMGPPGSVDVRATLSAAGGGFFLCDDGGFDSDPTISIRVE